jgi:pyruvate dehydrogenase E1 component alpha subunit
MAKILNSKQSRKTKAPTEETTFSLISNEKLLAIYSAMIKCQMLEQRATLLFQQGRLASDLHSSSRREAVAASIAVDLLPSDVLSIAPGDWLPIFVKGMPLEKLLRTLAYPSAHLNGHPTAPSSDLELKNAVAVDEAHRPESVRERAVAAQSAHDGTIVTAILPSPQGLLQPWHSVLVDAASKRLPIIFVHHVANQPSETPVNRKGRNPDALFHGVPAIAVDACDAVAVYRVAYEAIVRARQGRGATLLQCLADFDSLIDANVTISEPLSSMENYLRRKGIEPEQHRREIITAFNRDLELATRFLDQ